MAKAGGVGGVVWKIPEIGGVTPSHMLGAWVCQELSYWLLEICQPKAGQTVVVSGAAGAVGLDGWTNC